MYLNVTVNKCLITVLLTYGIIVALTKGKVNEIGGLVLLNEHRILNIVCLLLQYIITCILQSQNLQKNS